jgi:hypothetical protein
MQHRSTSVSKPPLWACVCEQERSVTLDPLALCIPLRSGPASPIDNFYGYVESVVLLGAPSALGSNEALRRVLLLGVVSATEHYFRALISKLVYLCPLVRSQASSLVLSLGALDYYTQSDVGLALLEHASLATAGEIQKQSQRILGIDIKQDPSTAAALLEYEKLCQFRHAAAHARGDLGHQNLRELGVSSSSGRLSLKVEFAAFQSAAAICQNIVRAYNRLLYRKTVERWVAEKVLRGSWVDDQSRYSPLFQVFYSRHDLQSPKTPYQSYRSLLPIIRKAVLSVGRI